MSEEKKKLTEEERKELKDKLKKQVDEMSDEELDKVAGGLPVFGKKYSCEYCGEEFWGAEELLDHINFVHHKI